MAAILLAGTTLADHVGPLPVFVLGLLPALPGYVVVCRQTSWRLLWLSLAATALAMPTLVSTMRGLAQGDPFLLYRQASTAAVGPRFGMPLSSFVVHGGVAVLLVLIVSVAPHPRSRLMRSVALGAFLSWFLLANNDNWGPSQEPNRFWIDGYMLILVTGFPLLAAVALDTIRRAWASPRKVGAGVMSVALVLWVGAAVTSAQDWLLFNEAARSKGISWWPSPRSEAIASVVSRMPREGIVVTDRCTDLLSVKAITGARVAFYNYGLAWPDNHIAITAVQKGREFRWLDPRVAREAGVGYLLTDSHCKMPRNTDGNVDLVASGQYVDPAGRTATLRLWKIRW